MGSKQSSSTDEMVWTGMENVVGAVARGGAASRFDARLKEVANAVVATGKTGSVSLTLKITPSKADVDAVEVEVSTSSKVPEFDMRSLFFVNDGGELVREDPRAIQMDLEGDR